MLQRQEKLGGAQQETHSCCPAPLQTRLGAQVTRTAAQLGVPPKCWGSNYTGAVSSSCCTDAAYAACAADAAAVVPGLPEHKLHLREERHHHQAAARQEIVRLHTSVVILAFKG